jgi:hypothetical protein
MALAHRMILARYGMARIKVDLSSSHSQLPVVSRLWLLLRRYVFISYIDLLSRLMLWPPSTVLARYSDLAMYMYEYSREDELLSYRSARYRVLVPYESMLS